MKAERPHQLGLESSAGLRDTNVGVREVCATSLVGHSQTHTQAESTQMWQVGLHVTHHCIPGTQGSAGQALVFVCDHPHSNETPSAKAALPRTMAF